MKPTFAQRRMLARLLANAGSSVSIETIERGGMEPPMFRGHYQRASCPHCGHATREAANWRVIFALVEGGYLRPQMRGADYYTADGITDAGHAALAA